MIFVVPGHTHMLYYVMLQMLQMRPQKEKVQMTQKQHKDLKDLRKQIALSKVNNITKVHI